MLAPSEHTTFHVRQLGTDNITCGPSTFSLLLPKLCFQGSSLTFQPLDTSNLVTTRLSFMPAAMCNLLPITHSADVGVVHTPVCSETCEKIRWGEVYSEVSVILSTLQP